ncbi:MAG: 50S ribosomal protein L24 [Desulfobacterales bacterium]|jgi:large subunit ribosomal protein L24|nr:50S ribosomal protein L24 [Desulfobacterales bacterium]MDP7416955.1 50S ribosomal protein L24 [Desulfobacterales bacterium]HJO62254.1 50S ribosomal protein L24 [Desulfobacterales bacterium]|tara:strand:- start:3097 stop:3423 length:327 start_codon:yes stop_codon:yes gene_type:complete
MYHKCHLRKDDKVKIITGKDQGKIGKVLKVIRKEDRILIENINIVKHHSKPTAKNRQGGILESESPIHWSNVMLMCNKCMTPVRIKMQRLDDGKKIRVCRKCNEIIDS